MIASRLSVPTTNKLAHHRTGAGEPLVLLHGVGESAVGWRPVHDELSKDYDVIAIDLPGFGHSPGLPAGVTPTAAALADPSLVLSSHLPAAPGGMTERLLASLEAAPAAQPFVGPDQAALEEMLAQMTGPQ